MNYSRQDIKANNHEDVNVKFSSLFSTESSERGGKIKVSIKGTRKLTMGEIKVGFLRNWRSIFFRVNFVSLGSLITLYHRIVYFQINNAQRAVKKRMTNKKRRWTIKGF